MAGRSKSNPIKLSTEWLMDTYGLDNDEDGVEWSNAASDTQSI